MRGQWTPATSTARHDMLRRHINGTWMGGCDDPVLGRPTNRTAWDWQGEPPIAKLDAARLCAALNALGSRSNASKGILFIGDSLAEQHAETMIGLLGASFCGGLAYKRNDFLTTPEQRQNTSNRENVTEGRNCAPFVQAWEQRPTFCFDWSSRASLSKYRAIVITQGMHFIEDDHAYTRQMQHVAHTIATRVRPGTLVMFRDTVPGVADCVDRQFAPPLTSLDEAEDLVWNKQRFFHGPLFKARNEKASAIFGAAGFVRLHVYVPTVLRQDSRLGYRDSRHGIGHVVDCVHYCLPGPTMVWADMVAARIVQAVQCGYGSQPSPRQ